MRRFIVNWVVIVVAVFIATALLPGKITYGSPTDIAIFAIVLGLLDAFLLPILKVLSFPINLITFGLFSLVLNALLFWLATVVEGNIQVAGVLTVFIAALIVSAVNLVLGRAL
ncbi:MAG: phage holin family protein [Chloroflexota bacterium]